VASFIADGTGEPFRHGPPVMKRWIVITHSKADWVALATATPSDLRTIVPLRHVV
jgi:hypothetical protein